MKKCIVMLLCAGLFLTGCASQKNPGMQFEESPAASHSAIKTITPDDKTAGVIDGSKNTETKDFTKLELKDYQITAYIDNYFRRKADEAVQNSDDGNVDAVIDSKKDVIETKFGDTDTSTDEMLENVRTAEKEGSVPSGTDYDKNIFENQFVDNGRFIINGQINYLFSGLEEIPFVSTFDVKYSDTDLNAKELNKICDTFGKPDGYIMKSDEKGNYICLVWEKGNYDIAIPLYMRMVNDIQRYGNVAKSYSAIVPKKYFTELTSSEKGYLNMFMQRNCTKVL